MTATDMRKAHNPTPGPYNTYNPCYCRDCGLLRNDAVRNDSVREEWESEVCEAQTPQQRYPRLMAYIADRSTQYVKTFEWCRKLREDEAQAKAGEFAEVTAEMEKAEADYAEQQTRLGRNPFPYNYNMGVFLGLPIRENREPPHGYYMARCVATHYRLGEATRKVQAAIQEGKELAIPTGRSRADRSKITKCSRFRGPEQIEIIGNTVVCRNGRIKITLSSNWSTETAMVATAKAFETGLPYGVKT